MSVPSELKASSRRFMEQLLMCRPGDSTSFAMQYFFDERCTTPSVNHAIHSLTFLIRKPVEFRSAVATIYCAETAASDSSADDGKAKSSSGAPSTMGSGIGNSTAGEKEDKSDSGVVRASPESKTGGESLGAAGDPSSSSSSSSSSTKESLSDSVARDENTSSLYLKRLCKIARMAIAASDGSLAVACSADKDGRNFSSSSSLNVPGTESTEWIYDTIEKFMQGDQISQAVSLNFETFISFLRLYLSLWASLDWLFKGVELLVESNTEGGSSIESHPIWNSERNDLKLSEPTLMPDDIHILGKSLKGTFASCTNEEKANIQVLVSRSFDIFAKSLLSGSTSD